MSCFQKVIYNDDVDFLEVMNFVGLVIVGLLDVLRQALQLHFHRRRRRSFFLWRSRRLRRVGVDQLEAVRRYVVRRLILEKY